MRFLTRSFLSLLKKDSATALSQQLPRRLILGFIALTDDVWWGGQPNQ